MFLTTSSFLKCILPYFPRHQSLLTFFLSPLFSLDISFVSIFSDIQLSSVGDPKVWSNRLLSITSIFGVGVAITPITIEEDASRLEVSSSWEQEEIRTHWHEQALPGHTWRLVHNSFSRWVSPAGMGGGPSKRLHREGKSVTIPRHPQLSAFLGIFGRIMRWKKTHLFLRLGSTRSPPDHSLALGSSLI